MPNPQEPDSVAKLNTPAANRYVRWFGIACTPAHSRSITIGFGLTFFVVSLLSCLQAASQRNELTTPPIQGGDQDDYERLGYNLASGLGFGYCPSDRLMIQGLIERPNVSKCVAGCTPEEFQVSSFRPPGFPLLIAAVYQVSPLNFTAIRIINCLCCAVAIGLVSAFLARRLSLIAGFTAGAVCSIDPRFREFAGTFLTENLATLTLSVFAITLMMFLRRKTILRSLLCGLSLSMLVFNRSFFVAWYPFVWLLILVALFRATIRRELTRSRAIQSLAMFCISSLLLTAPWWVRNCLVLNALMPTGTQGGIGICDGFSDSAYEHFGSWTPKTASKIAAEMKSDPKLAALNWLEFEKELSRRGAAHAKQWIQEHPELLLQLSLWKLERLWELRSIRHTILFLVCFVGLWAARKDTSGGTIFFLLLLNSLTVVATYHTYERFMTPFRPLIHGMAGYGMQAIAVTLLCWWQRRTSHRAERVAE